MKPTTRRGFLELAPVAATALMAACSPAAAAGPMVDEKDPQAVALSYVSDAARVDKAKAPNFVPGSRCGNCALYQGGTADAGPCPLYPGKRVAAAGWCSSWAKKT